MSLFSGLTTADNTDIQEETDSLGGGGVLDTGLYHCKIKMAYAREAASGALGVNVFFEDVATGREFRITEYVTSGNAKGKKNYFERDGKKFFLPGFNQINSMCLLAVGKELAEIDTETKSVKIYSPEAKAEVPTDVPVLLELLGKEIIVGLVKQTVDKRQKNDAGEYVATGETRDENAVDKMFRASDRKTFAEIKAGSDASFIDAWEEKNKGKTRDRTSKDAKNNAGSAGAPKAAAGSTKPKSSLFS